MVPACECRSHPIIGVYGNGGGGPMKRGFKASRRQAAELLGIDWGMSMAELSQAIPPAYTEHLGAQILAVIR